MVSKDQKKIFVIPYIDQPLSFWNNLEDNWGEHIAEVYFPIKENLIGTGRPQQARQYEAKFLSRTNLIKGVLINPISLPMPAEQLAPAIIEELKMLYQEFGVCNLTITDLNLAKILRKALPYYHLTASILMEITSSFQTFAVNGICDTIVPGSGAIRDLPALKAVRASHQGKVRLLVNEGCLQGCPFRVQHFQEMADSVSNPKSLCANLLSDHPWMRLTGGWITPQYLHLYEGIFDEIKLAGRVTLRNPEAYVQTLSAYINRIPLKPNEIGGGPSSVFAPIEMDDELFEYTLTCGRACHTCTKCPEYYEKAISALNETIH